MTAKRQDTKLIEEVKTNKVAEMTELKKVKSELQLDKKGTT